MLLYPYPLETSLLDLIAKSLRSSRFVQILMSIHIMRKISWVVSIFGKRTLHVVLWWPIWHSVYLLILLLSSQYHKIQVLYNALLRNLIPIPGWLYNKEIRCWALVCWGLDSKGINIALYPSCLFTNWKNSTYELFTGSVNTCKQPGMCWMACFVTHWRTFGIVFPTQRVRLMKIWHNEIDAVPWFSGPQGSC